MALLVETSLSSGQDILMGVGQYMRAHTQWAVYAQPHDLSQPPPGWFENWEGDGIIARLQSGEVLHAVRDKGVPVVDVLGVEHIEEIPLVHVDNSAISEMAAEHLLDRGFREFAYFGLKNEYWSIERQRGFSEYLLAKDFSCNNLTLSRRTLEQTSWESLVDRAAVWVETLPSMVGIMLCSDVRGLLLQEACRKAGRIIGQNVALIGVGNDRTLCELSNPPLTSVEANHVSVGYEAAALLDRMMAGEPPPESPILVKPLFVGMRSSTDFLAIDDAATAKALHYIRNNSDKPLKVDQVAKYAGLSRSVLQRRFQMFFSRTVLEEITASRIHRAIELLRQTDLSVEIVAEKTGFGSAQNMGRIFRKNMHESPQKYRNR